MLQVPASAIYALGFWAVVLIAWTIFNGYITYKNHKLMREVEERIDAAVDLESITTRREILVAQREKAVNERMGFVHIDSSGSKRAVVGTIKGNKT